MGPRPFEREDRALFFGRDREASDVVSLVIAHRVLVLYAQSGAGKSSLINAEVTPQLKEKGFEVLPTARVRGLIPSSVTANAYVFNVLAGWMETDRGDERLSGLSLAEFLGERPRAVDEDGTPSPRVVIFDQFEELFSLYAERWAEREGFFEQVRDALEADPLLRVVFVMREDFIAQMDAYAPLLPEEMRTRYRLERLNREAAISAVRGPLTATSRAFAEGTAERLVEDLMKVRIEAVSGDKVTVTGQFAEPVYLQVVCERLWRELPPDATIITDKHLQDFGDVNQALSRFFESSVQSAIDKTRVKEHQLRAWIEEGLITPAGTRGTAYRGKKETGGIPNTAVDVLEDQHLVRGEWRAGARWYELTHDRLIEPVQASNEAWKARQRRRNMIRLTVATAVVLVASTMGILGLLLGLLSQKEGADGFLVKAAESEVILGLFDTDCWLVGSATLNPDGANEQEIILAFDPAQTARYESSCAYTTSDSLEVHEPGEKVVVSRIEPAEFDLDPAWSPDGGQIAFVSGRRESDFHVGIFLMNADGSGLARLTDGAAGINLAPVWSPDGERIAFASDRDGNGEIYVMNADGMGLKNLTNSPMSGDFDPAWSPDGEHIAFASDRSGDFDIYEIHPDGSDLFNLTEGAAGDDIQPAWSPDGGRIAFTSDRDGNAEIYVMDMDGSDQSNLTNSFGNEGGPAWSPDGERIAFTADRDGDVDVYVMNADGSEQRNLTNSDSEDVGPTWSPNGQEIAYFSNADGSFRIYVISDPSSFSDFFIVNLTREPAGDDYDPSSSPDGNQIAFSSDRSGNTEIYVMNTDGSSQANLTGSTARSGNQPAWSPDGGRIAFYTGDPEDPVEGNEEIEVISPDGSDQVNLTNSLGDDFHPAWSPDGSRIVFISERDGNAEIYVMDSDGDDQVNLTNSASSDIDAVWSWDGAQIAFASERSGDYEIYVMNADGSGQVNLTNSPGGDFQPAWSPDGARIAFTSQRDGNLEVYVINADGSGLRRITVDPAADEDPAWSSDGLAILFSSQRDGDSDIFSTRPAPPVKLTGDLGEPTPDMTPPPVPTFLID